MGVHVVIKKGFFLLITILLIATACNHKSSINTPTNVSDDYPSTKATENGDVVNLHGTMMNLDQLDIFIDQVRNHQEDFVRIVNYTTEGDLIIQELKYDGEKIEYTFDSTRDAYGAGKVSKTACKGIGKEVTDTFINSSEKMHMGESTAFYLTDCSNENDKHVLLYVPKNKLPNKVEKEEAKFEMRIQKEIYDKPVDEITVEIKNFGSTEITFGTYFWVEKFENDTWNRVPFKENKSFTDIGLHLNPGETYKQIVHLQMLNERLTEGKYRIVKEFTSNDTVITLAAEFEISK
jgi:hypothetical protein